MMGCSELSCKSSELPHRGAVLADSDHLMSTADIGVESTGMFVEQAFKSRLREMDAPDLRLCQVGEVQIIDKIENLAGGPPHGRKHADAGGSRALDLSRCRESQPCASCPVAPGLRSPYGLSRHG